MTGGRESYDALRSTQDRAIALARAGAEAGTSVVARRQTAARGRSDHAWASPVGGLYVSVVVASPDEHASLLPIAIGAYLARALHRRFRVPLGVKWPNDLLATSRRPARKLGGILVDRIASPRLGAAAVAGVGLNVATAPHDFPESLRGSVATLREESAVDLGPSDVEAMTVAAVEEAARSIATTTGATIARGLCREWLWGVGRPASVDGRPVGRIVGLGDEGELLVEDRGARVAIRAGDLRVDEGA